MPGCFVPHCPCTDRSNANCDFIRFPKDKGNLKKWLTLIRRQNVLPKESSRICTCHFQKSQPTPSLFPWNKEKLFNFVSPEKRKRRTRLSQKPDEKFTATQIQRSTDQELDRGDESEISQFSTEDELALISAAENNTNEANELTLISPMENDECPLVSVPTNITAIKDTENTNALPLHPPTSDQSSSENISKLQIQIKQLQIENEAYKEQCIFGVHRLTSDKMMVHYTGVTLECFEIITKLCRTVKFVYVLHYKPSTITFRNQILMTLMKLRLNLTNLDLAVRFNISDSGVSNIIRTLIAVLHKVLFQKMIEKVQMPSQLKNSLCLPSAFNLFHNCRAVLDCTEFKCEKPGAMDLQKKMFSNYKQTHTVKVLISVAPNGVITFVSAAYPGSTSDKAIVEHCNILKQFHPGDLILADKGFLLKDIVPQGVLLNIPPLLCNPQFTETEITETRNIARARIHVERAIRRIKCFRIVSCFTPKMMPFATEII